MSLVVFRFLIWIIKFGMIDYNLYFDCSLGIVLWFFSVLKFSYLYCFCKWKVFWVIIRVGVVGWEWSWKKN